jgi:hypothetical protein
MMVTIFFCPFLYMTDCIRSLVRRLLFNGLERDGVIYLYIRKVGRELPDDMLCWSALVYDV